MKNLRNSFIYDSVLLVGLLITTMPAMATDDGNFYVKPFVGLGFAMDDDITQSGVVTAGATGTGEYELGWAAGLGIGYRYGNGWIAEIDWTYRNNSNDTIGFSDGSSFNDGNIASNIIFLNGYYAFDLPNSRFRPYVGAGIGWVEELDLDLETAGTEISYATDGDVAWQFMAGVEADLAESWSVNGEFRYTGAHGLDLEQENGTGTINDVDYNTWMFTTGVSYHF